MNAAATLSPVVAHRIPGRLRLKTQCNCASVLDAVVKRLTALRGVRLAKAEPLTGSIVIQFDPALVEETQILAQATSTVDFDEPQEEEAAPIFAPRREEHSHSIIHEGLGRRGSKVVRRVRVAVRGIDRNSTVARKVVDRLMLRPGVHAEASALTGRVLIEFDEEIAELRDLLGDICDVELPSLPGEDNPSHPLDPAPLTQSSVRVSAAAVGLGVLATRRLFGAEGAIVSNPSLGYVSGIFNIAQSIPWFRNGVRKVVGRNAGDLAMGLPDMALSALIGSPLSLIVNGVGALRLCMTVSARRQSWRSYEDRLGAASNIQAGATIRLESGEITPMPCIVIEGSGTAIESHGLACHFSPGSELPPGSKLRGHGPFVVELIDTKHFEPTPRTTEPQPEISDHYHQWNAPVSLLFATGLGILTRSPGRAFEGLLCLSPRAATAGTEAARLNAVARVIRGGSVVVGTRPNRPIELPDTLILESARILTDGLEIARGGLIEPGIEASEALNLAAQVSHSCGSVWGDTFGHAPFSGPGTYAHGHATATIDGVDFTLALEHNQSHHEERGHQGFVLSRESRGIKRDIALFSVRPRISPAATTLLDACSIHKVNLVVLSSGRHDVVEDIALRTGINLVHKDAVPLITTLQEQGERVAYVSDGAQGAEPFEQCDLAIGVTSGRNGPFSARADILAPDLLGVCSIIESSAITNRVKRDSVGFGVIANVIGGIMCVLGPTGIVAASRAVHLATLASYANAAFKFRGGERSTGYSDRYADPRPEQRWGKQPIIEVLKELDATSHGLSTEDAEHRLQDRSFADNPSHEKGSAFLRAIGAQLRSPLIAIMAGGAVLTFAVGTPVEFAMVSLTIVANVLFGAWQEQQVQGASKALANITPNMATVIRDGELRVISSLEIVLGDIVQLAPGDRVPADVRLVESASLEVDEASLTGESLPVPKSHHSSSASGRILLEGSDVIVGRAKAVVVAVGRKTRMGSIAAAISQDEQAKSPLNNRLAILLQQFLPIAAGAGVVVFVAGLLQGRPLMPELVLATTLALSAIPEGLPLLAGVAEVAVSRRLVKRGAYLRRLGASEALGRVDVACTDKTGTLTQGKLLLSLVATTDRVAVLDSSDEWPEVSDTLREIVLAAGLASPHPDAANVRLYPTDNAVIEGAKKLGFLVELHAPREDEAPFEATRAFHASKVGDCILVKGAPEVIVERCAFFRRDGGDVLVQDSEREMLLHEAERIAARGMRVLMVAQGDASGSVDDPQNLTALGFLGIRDPLKPGAREAIARCQRAGVRVIILTGDHPATARTIAMDAGLQAIDGNVLTGVEMSRLTNDEVDERMKRVTIVARVTPLDKVRIVESLQRMGHVVAMTGDGVNDAPALRLSDVGIAMGKGGTEVARQVADVVLGDDEFTTIVDALVEGRAFWRNIRCTLGLLLGGILGELGFVAIAAAIGLPAPLNTRQILSMNLITFGLPTLAVALQEPEHQNLAGLEREGTTALEKPLQRDVMRRAAATIIPSLAAYMFALPFGQAQAQTVAFCTTIGSQLVQTLGSGQVESGLTKSVVGAVGVSLGLIVGSICVPQARMLLSLAIPILPALMLIVIGSCASPLVARALSVSERPNAPRALPALATA